MSLAIRSNIAPAGLTDSIRREVLALDKGEPIYRVQTMDEVVQKTTATRRASMLLLSIFATAALLLAAIGIYGVMAYSVAQRTREIGIRMALGAQTGDVLRLIVRQGMLLAFAGAAIGLVVSIFLARAIGSLLSEPVRAGEPPPCAVPILNCSLDFRSSALCQALSDQRVAPWELNPVTALAQN